MRSKSWIVRYTTSVRLFVFVEALILNHNYLIDPWVLCGPRVGLPDVPHLRGPGHRPRKVRLPVPQRDPVRPAVLCLQLVVQR